MKKSVLAGIAGVAVLAIVAAVVVSVQIQSQTEDSTDAAMHDQLEQPSQNTESKIKVIASFYPLYDFSKNVAGDKADISSFVPMGVEPHDWEPSTGDILRLKEAKVFVYNGGGFEPYVDKLLGSGEYDNVIFIETMQGVKLLKIEGHEEHLDGFIEEIEHMLRDVDDGHISASDAINMVRELVHEHERDERDHDGILEEIEHILHEVEDNRMSNARAISLLHDTVEREEKGDRHGHAHDFEFDPHIWLDPILVKHQVTVITNALVEADPANAMYYEDNARAYNAQLDSLDAKIRSELSNCKKDTFVPFHNAFSYLADRYDLKVHALSGLAPESEATATELKRLVDFVREHDIKVIFAEDLVDPRLAEVLASEVGAQVLILSPIEGLSQEEISSGKTYLTKMEENITNLKVALECQ